MEKLKNLAYRTKRFFQGESGVVERVESQDPFDKNNYWKDDDMNLPNRIFVRNLLGELISDLTSLRLKRVDNLGIKPNYDVRVYKTYKPGDKFP